MSDEQKERRINLENLPQDEQELTAEEAKKVQGGIIMANTEGDFIASKPTEVRVATGDVNGDNLITGTGVGGGPHVKGS